MKYPGMGDRYEWMGEYWRDTQANTAGSGINREGLTLEKLQAVMRSIPKPPPMPMPKYDIYPSDFTDQTYEINVPDDIAPRGFAGRTMLVAKPAEAWRWYTELRKLGADVRWQPRLDEAGEPA
jgi:hypothetical protein